MLPKLQACARRGRGGRRLRAHRRRARAALAAARAVHRRGHRDEGGQMTSAMQLGARAGTPLRDADLQAAAGRVRARRGRAPLRRRGRGVPRLPCRDLGLQRRALPPARRRGDPRPGRAADPRVQPLLHRAGGAAGGAARDELRARRARLPVQLRRRGERGRDQACPQAPPRRRDRRARGRLPRAHDGRASATPQRDQAGAVRAARAGLRRRSRATTRRRSRPRSASAPPR